MGFYKVYDGALHEAPNAVYSPIVTLTVDTKDDFEYPQDGWYWFDTVDEAEAKLGASKQQ